MTPKISVIVPVYKAEQYLHRCVDSILTQSFTDFELILIDDGSPDNSGNICDEYAAKDTRVKVVHKENGGVSSARNVGIENATGEWITFVDADDFIEMGFLSIPIDTSADLLIQDYKVTSSSGEKFIEFPKRFISENEMSSFVDENIHKEIFFSPWAKYFKRSIVSLNNLEFVEGMKVGEDSLFVLDYLYYTKSVQFLNSASYIYVGGFSGHKYRLEIDTALEYYKGVISRYEKLNAQSKIFLKNTFWTYYGLLHPKSYKSLMKWQRDDVVRRVYRNIYRGLGLKYNIVYLINPLLERICELCGRRSKRY